LIIIVGLSLCVVTDPQDWIAHPFLPPSLDFHRNISKSWHFLAARFAALKNHATTTNPPQFTIQKPRSAHQKSQKHLKKRPSTTPEKN
jgi:hypothetical protein